MGADVYEAARRGQSRRGGKRAAGPPNTVQGVREMIQTFRDLRALSTLETISYRATFGAAKELALLAQANANARTLATKNPGGGKEKSGALAKAFAWKRIREGTKRGYTVGVRAGAPRKRFGLSDPFYWWFLEFGTVHIAPMSFFRDAIQAKQPQWLRTIQQAGLKAVMSSAKTALRKIGKAPS